MKVFASSEAATAVANWVASEAPVELSVASNLEVHEAEVLINARAHGSPEALAQHVRQTVAELAERYALTYEIRSVQHFRPSRPEPVHRYASPQGENTSL